MVHAIDSRRSRANRVSIAAILFVLAISHAAAASADVPVDPGTYLSVGPGIYLQPTYPGASGTRGFFLPYIDAEYHDWLYSNAADLLGVYAYKTPTTQMGAAIQYDFTERLNKDDARFRFLRDVRATPRIKLFASHTIGLLTGDVNVATDVAGRDQGTLAQANLSLAIPFVPKFFFSVGPGLTWANSTYMQSFFGITPGQSLVSQLPAYDARAGIVDLHINALANYTISKRWSLGTTTYWARLHGDADGSPITQRRSQLTVIAFLAYTF
jgi:outer membrane scaffolding protein for murein synthesis (MipA/OmpV family)